MLTLINCTGSTTTRLTRGRIHLLPMFCMSHETVYHQSCRHGRKFSQQGNKVFRFKMSAKVLYMSDRLKAIVGKCAKVGDHFILQPIKGRSVSVNSQGYHNVHVSLPAYRPMNMVLVRAVFMLRHDRMDLFPGGVMRDWHV